MKRDRVWGLWTLAMGGTLCAVAATLLFGQATPAVPRNTAQHTHDHSHEPDRPEDAKALIAQGESPDLLMVYSGDVIGYLDPCG